MSHIHWQILSICFISWTNLPSVWSSFVNFKMYLFFVANLLCLQIQYIPVTTDVPTLQCSTLSYHSLGWSVVFVGTNLAGLSLLGNGPIWPAAPVCWRHRIFERRVPGQCWCMLDSCWLCPRQWLCGWPGLPLSHSLMIALCPFGQEDCVTYLICRTVQHRTW